jgi:hypothetical protein
MSNPLWNRSRNNRHGWFTVAVVAVVATVVAAFVVGRATSSESGGSSVRAASRAQLSRSAVTSTTVGGINVDEIVENRPDQPLDPATRTKLAAQLVAARTAAAQYPTVASARAAGMIQAGLFAPELGAHFISYANLNRSLLPDGSVDAQYPPGFIYDGVSPTSKLVGLMYISIVGGTPPAGFAGPNDHWHRHMNLCIKYGTHGKISVPFAPDRDVTRAQCDKVRGQFMPRTVWMVHAWVVPGWESPKGVFSHANPDLRCADGTVNTDAVGFCKGT